MADVLAERVLPYPAGKPGRERQAEACDPDGEIRGSAPLARTGSCDFLALRKQLRVPELQLELALLRQRLVVLPLPDSPTPNFEDARQVRISLDPECKFHFTFRHHAAERTTMKIICLGVLT